MFPQTIYKQILDLIEVKMNNSLNLNIQVHRILQYPKIMLLSSFAVRDCNVIVIKESSLRPSLIEQTIALYSEVGDIVIFPWLPDAEMLAIAHRLKRRIIAGDSNLKHCQNAIAQLGLNLEEISQYVEWLGQV